jgi:stage II sporulation protein R
MARFFVALALCACVAFAPLEGANARAPEALEGLIRLQVVARSDCPTDQLEKLRVRDRVRAAAVEIVRGAADSDEAYRRLRSSRKALSRAALAPVELREVAAPVRAYGRVVVPAGRYRTVRVVLGGGAGRNWWCVLYPDLCGTDAMETDALQGDRPVVFYSDIMRWIEAMKGDVT